ncbi:TetR/AcrR family transcriptional regulator [Kitasatospora sp. NPDC057223]|uniref:TetR/AcrR family transcriptional regulator n=1 Tax=Kitasatospora sp. NPDC057223 TaxID=3346055 RepID=UPI003633A09F
MTAQVTRRRRRGSELEHAILEAVREELAAVGYAGLTMDGVAARAQTSKPVLYRRWPSRAQLVMAAMRRDVPSPGELPDTGELRSDLVALLRRLARRFDDWPKGMIAGLLAETLSDPELSVLIQDLFTGPMSQLAAEVLERAAARGEIHGERLTPRIRRLPLDLLRSEVFLRGQAPPDLYIDQVVDEILLPLLHAI